MRPLSSPVHDHRVLGRAEAIIGMAFIIIASALSPADAFVGVFIMTPLVGSLLYFFTFRPAAQRAVRAPAQAPIPERADPGAYLRRIRWPLVAQVVVYIALTATARAPGLLGGIAFGIGLALIFTSRWLERWEIANEVALLREPGTRRRSGGTGGYYIVGQRKTQAPGVANHA